MLVKDIMSSPVITIKDTDTVGKAMEMMKSDGIRHLPVVNKDNALIGIVAERDILKVFPRKNNLDKFQFNLLSRTLISNIMSTDLLTVNSSDTVENAAMAMEKRKFGCVPVVDDYGLVGLVSEADIFNTFIEALGIEKPGLRITLKLQKKRGFLDQLVQLFDSNQAIIDNFVTFSNELVVKVRNGNETKLLKELLTSGFEILHVSKEELKETSECAIG